MYGVMKDSMRLATKSNRTIIRIIFGRIFNVLAISSLFLLNTYFQKSIPSLVPKAEAMSIAGSSKTPWGAIATKPRSGEPPAMMTNIITIPTINPLAKTIALGINTSRPEAIDMDATSRFLLNI